MFSLCLFWGGNVGAEGFKVLPVQTEVISEPTGLSEGNSANTNNFTRANSTEDGALSVLRQRFASKIAKSNLQRSTSAQPDSANRKKHTLWQRFLEGHKKTKHNQSTAALFGRGSQGGPGQLDLAQRLSEANRRKRAGFLERLFTRGD